MTRLATGEGEALLERFRRYLREHRQPVTRQRVRVADVVLTSEEHLSVEQIRRRLAAEGRAVGLATIYRTLDLLVEAGLARDHDFGQGYRRFEPVPGREAHEHLICVRCGQVLEFAHERLARMLPIIADEHGFQPERHRVEIYGVCRNCQRRGLG
ncbi:MAG TPA: Fur family transcriptional regulator [Gemmatimonadales bacterium]|nr:Fur family transcriptional regulator [Gemmatimonadales bacterium]